MSVRYQKKHVRRTHAEEFVEWVTVGEDGLSVEVDVPDWSSPRTFDFHFLVPCLATSLAQAVAHAFGQFAARFARSTAVSRYQEFGQLWRAISPGVLASHGVANFRTGALASAWKDAARAYATAEYRRVETQTSAKASMQALWTVLDELASCGLLPDVPAVPTPKNIHLRKVPRPGLVELAAQTKQAEKEAKSELLRHFESIGIPVEEPEVEAYIATLAAILSPEERKEPKKAVKAYIAKSKEFVDSVVAAAETELLRWAALHQRGQVLLLAGDRQVLDAFDRGALTGKAFRQLFPIHDSDTSTANFLLLARERFGGRVPTSESLGVHLGTPSRALNLYRELGGAFHLEGLLNLHRNGVAAAATLYIADAGANVSTALALKADFEQPTSEPGIVQICSLKPRANYAPIYDALPVNQPGRRISTVKALRLVRDATANLRRAFPSLDESLLVFRFFEEPSIANGEFLANQFGYLLKASGLPPNWSLSAIRAAVAVVNALDETGTLNGVRRTLHHSWRSQSTTAGYALVWPVRIELELKMSKYMSLFEAGLASNLDGALAWLGKSSDEARALLNEGARTGLGFLASQSSAGPESGDERKVGPDSDARADGDGYVAQVVLVDEESLTEIIATHMSLTANLDRLKEESVERFEDFWSELFAFANAAIAVAKRSQFAYLVPKATRRAEEWIAKGFDISDLRP